MTNRNRILVAAAFALALPAAAWAQPDQTSADQPAAHTYPMCSATVTDNCMQHGASHAARHMKAAHHRKAAHHKMAAHHRKAAHHKTAAHHEKSVHQKKMG